MAQIELHVTFYYIEYDSLLLQYMTELDNIAAACAEGFTCTTTVLDSSSTEGRDLKYIEVIHLYNCTTHRTVIYMKLSLSRPLGIALDSLYVMNTRTYVTSHWFIDQHGRWR